MANSGSSKKEKYRNESTRTTPRLERRHHDRRPSRSSDSQARRRAQWRLESCSICETDPHRRRTNRPSQACVRSRADPERSRDNPRPPGSASLSANCTRVPENRAKARPPVGPAIRSPPPECVQSCHLHSRSGASGCLRGGCRFRKAEVLKNPSEQFRDAQMSFEPPLMCQALPPRLLKRLAVWVGESLWRSLFPAFYSWHPHVAKDPG